MKQLWPKILGEQRTIEQLKLANARVLNERLAQESFELGPGEMERIGDWLIDNVPEATARGSRGNAINVAKVIWVHCIRQQISNEKERTAFVKLIGELDELKLGDTENERRIAQQFAESVGAQRARTLLHTEIYEGLQEKVDEMWRKIKKPGEPNPYTREYSLFEIWNHGLFELSGKIHFVKQHLR